jgi:hypothetical protein
MQPDTLIGEGEAAQFCATADSRRGFGTTPREALDALLEIMPNSVPAPIVIWPRNQGDGFFSDAQQSRLQDLKSRAGSLTAAERDEWERLVETSFDATIARTQNLPTAKS